MDNSLVQLITVVIGAVGIGIYFNVEKSKIPYITVGALIAWISYLIVMGNTNNIFMSCMVSSMIVSIYSEISARILKSPANMFLIPSLVTLLPGGSFYYMMESAINMEMTMFKLKAFETIMTVCGISVGVILGSSIFMLIFNNAVSINSKKKVDNKSEILEEVK